MALWVRNWNNSGWYWEMRSRIGIFSACWCSLALEFRQAPPSDVYFYSSYKTGVDTELNKSL